MERLDSQTHLIRLWLEKGNTITPLSALQMFGCFRLSAIIYILKERGMNIDTEIVYRGKRRWAEYKLVR